MKLQGEELEYAISQYLDGNLPALQRPALDEQFANDADARALLAEYRDLNDSLRTAMPMPAIDWAQLSVRISGAIENEEPPIQHYKIAAWKWIAPIALAASLFIAIGIGLHQSGDKNNAPPQNGVAMIQGPAAEKISGPSIAEVSIGPSPALADQFHAGQEIIERPTMVLIDRAAPANSNEGDQSLY